MGGQAGEGLAPGAVRWSAGELAVAALVLAVAAAARFHYIGSQSLWLDEGFSWWDAKQSLAEIWRLVPHCDPHPPLYAVLLKAWMAAFGESPGAIRSLNAVVSVIATGVVMLAGREVSPRAGVIAGILFATAPFQIEHSHEARPYVFLVLAGALVTFGALRVVRVAEHRGNHLRNGWAALVIGSALALWTNNTAILLLGAVGIAAAGMFVFDRGMRAMLRPAVIAMLVIVAIWAPYVPTLAQQAGEVSADFWIQPPTPWRIANELRFAIGFWTFESLVPLGILWLTGLWLLWRGGGHRQAVVLASIVVMTVALNVAISLLVRPVFIARALIGMAPAFFIAVALALDAVGDRRLRWAGVVAVGAAQLYFAASAFYVDYPRKEPWAGIARHVADSAGKDGIVLTVANQEVLPLSHALQTAGLSVPMRGLPVDYPAPGLAARYPSGKCTPSLAGQDLKPIKRIVAGHPTVVFVTRHDNVYDPKRDVERVLGSLGYVETRLMEYEPGMIEVRTFVRSALPAANGGEARKEN